MFIEGYIASKLLDEVLIKLKKIFSDNEENLSVSKKDIENSVSLHLKYVKNFSETISFKDLQGKKSLDNTYINLTLYLTPLKDQLHESEKNRVVSLDKVLENESSHTIILGQVGAGKTTAMKKICQYCLFNENFRRGHSFPLFIALKELSDSNDSLISYILKILGVIIKVKEDESATVEFNHKVCVSVLETLSPILILDGFDEIEYTLREKIGNEIKKLCLSLDSTILFITSRTSEFYLDIENASTFEISNLSDSQIEEFVNKWFENEKDIKDFIFQLNKSTYKDTSLRPLNLAHLCAIYERCGKQIPEKPKTVYRKIVNLLLEEWDEQRNIQRASKFLNFPVDRKREFLSHLAFELTTKYNKLQFDKYILTNIYMETLSERFSLPLDDAKRVIQEVEAHSGIFAQTSYSDYEFSHKSIQEFLCADYIIALPEIPSDTNLLEKIPNEMAIAVSLSSRPSIYFSNFILNNLFQKKWFDTRNIELSSSSDSYFVSVIYNNFLETFLNRLLIEKIDFDSSPLTSITYLYLYTVCSIMGNRTDNEQKVLKLLTNSLQQNPVKKSVSNLMLHYDIIENARIGKKQLVKKDPSQINYMTVPRYLNFSYAFLE